MEWLSRKAVDYILAPKRGAFNLINPPICSTITAKGQNNWIGTFISPDIDFVERDAKLGGEKPTVIHLVDGTVYEYDGKRYTKRD